MIEQNISPVFTNGRMKNLEKLYLYISSTITHSYAVIGFLSLNNYSNNIYFFVLYPVRSLLLKLISSKY